MTMPSQSVPEDLTREQRIHAILAEVQPQLDALARRLAERAVDVSEAQEFGAIDTEFRDAGLEMANTIRQASLASRKKRGTRPRA